MGTDRFLVLQWYYGSDSGREGRDTGEMVGSEAVGGIATETDLGARNRLWTISWWLYRCIAHSDERSVVVA